MAGRGPKRNLAVLKLRGSWRAKQKTAEVIAPVGSPAAKGELTGEARKCFDELVGLTTPFGAADGWLLTQFATAWSEWSAIANDKTDKAFRRRTVLQKQLLALSDRLGLSPAARARLAVPAKKETIAKETKAKFFAS